MSSDWPFDRLSQLTKCGKSKGRKSIFVMLLKDFFTEFKSQGILCQIRKINSIFINVPFGGLVFKFCKMNPFGISISFNPQKLFPFVSSTPKGAY